MCVYVCVCVYIYMYVFHIVNNLILIFSHSPSKEMSVNYF